MPFAVQPSQHILAAAIDKVVPVLHCSHGEYLAGGFDIGDRNLAQPCMADHTVVEQLTDRAELLITGNARELPEVDQLDAEFSEASFGAFD